MEYTVHSLRIVVIPKMTDVGDVEEILLHLVHLEEDIFVAGYHYNVDKAWHKSWHDLHIKNKQSWVGDLVLINDINFLKHLGNIRTHWLRPYIVSQIT